MKSTNKLKEIYKQAEDDGYYSFEIFEEEAKLFLKDVRKRNLVMAMRVTRNGMTRFFNSSDYNRLMNTIYNQKMSHDKIKVGGCGMDMHWNLIHSCCEALATKGECEKYNYNSLASNQPLL